MLKCPKCNSEVGNMEFCEVCGAAVVNPQNDNAGAASREISKAHEETAAAGVISATKEGINIKVPEFSFKVIVAIGAIVFVLIAAIVGFSKMNTYYSPEATFERYCNLLAEGDTDKAFSMLEVTESQFITKDSFKEYIESLNLIGKQPKEARPADKVNNLLGMFGQDQQSNSITKQLKYYQVQFDTDAYLFSLIQSGKKLGIFDNWKVLASDFTKKWQIVAPKGSKVFVNGIQVERVEVSENNGLWGFSVSNYMPESLTYSIDGIFPGNYDITATMPGARDFKTTANAGQQQTIKFEPTDATVKELQQVANNFFDLAYSNADKSKFTDIISPDSDLMQMDKITVGGLYGFYDDTAVYKLDSLDLVDTSPGVLDDVTHAKLQFQVKVSVTTDEMLSWFSTETKQVTSQQTNFYEMSFVNTDGKWFLLDPGSMY